MIVMQDEVANDWCSDKAGEREEVWDSVDILVGSKLS
jgi:hypothetical protein